MIWLGVSVEDLYDIDTAADTFGALLWVWTLCPTAELDPLADVSSVIRHEHERWDGHGYPDHLAGADIPLAARILCACDAYHAMTSDFLESMDQEAENMVRSARTTDHKEAVRAFVEKRKPAFAGH